jgi:hypothetical protein
MQMLKNSQPLKSSIVGILIIACTMGMLSGCGEKALSTAKPTKSWIDTNPVIQSFLTDLGKWNTTNKRRLQIEFGWIYTPHYEKPSHTKQSPIPAPYLTETLTELMTEAMNPSLSRRIHPETRNRLFERNPRRGKSELVTAGTVRHYKPSIVDSATQLTLTQWVQHKQQSHGLNSVLQTYEPTEPVTFGQFCQWATVLMNLHKPTVNPQDTTIVGENAPLSNELQDYFKALKRKKRTFDRTELAKNIEEFEQNQTTHNDNNSSNRIIHENLELLLYEVLNTLNQEQQWIFRLSWELKLSNQEISEILSKSIKAVESIRFRTMLKIKEQLSHKFDQIYGDSE